MQLRPFVFLIAILTLLFPARGFAAETLRGFVQTNLAHAPTNFSDVRGSRKGQDVYFIRYAILPKIQKTCLKCSVVDEFAWTAHAENWYLEDRWTDSEKWSAAKMASYFALQLSPVLKGYSLKRTGSTEYPTFKWSNAKNLWVYIDTFKGGFTLRIGHDLTTPSHTLATLSGTELDELRNSVTNFINLGVNPASENFQTLRTGGKKDFMGDMEYGMNVSFAPMLRECTISDSTNNSMGLKDFSPKWILSCDTIPMVGSLASLEEPIRAAMWNALPSGFTTTTDKDLLFMDDYRWDDTDTSVAADIDSFNTFTLPNGLVQFTLQIIHFLPKAVSGGP